jgi:hypothetical protein
MLMEVQTELSKLLLIDAMQIIRTDLHPVDSPVEVKLRHRLTFSFDIEFT